MRPLALPDDPSRLPARACGLALIATFGLLLAACDLFEAARATVVVSGIVAATPEVKLDGAFDLPSQVLATVYVGERESATSTEEPKPIPKSEVSIAFAGNRLKLREETGEDGVYFEDSVENPDLIYAEGKVYIFRAVLPGDDTGEHGGSTRAPTRLSPASMTLSPAPARIIPGLSQIGTHPKNTDLRVQWTAQNGRYAYLTVLRGDPAKPAEPAVVFDSSPKTAGEAIKLILGTPPTSILIPGATFSEDGAYAVLLVAMDKGEPRTNTFLGSPLLAGSGAAVILAVGDFTP